MFSRSDKEESPNKFTIQMGRLIKTAREEAGMSQSELAKKAYRRRETISMMENGKSEVGTLTLSNIALAVDKPLLYFFPHFVYRELGIDELSAEEQEMLQHFRRIWSDENVEVIIAQIKAMAELEEKRADQMRWEQFKQDIDKDSKLYRRLKRKGFFED